MDTNLILFSVICIMIIGIGGFVIKKLKQKNGKIYDNENPEEFLKDFTSLVLSIANTSLNILSESKDEYPDEREFKERLVYIVATELRKELIESEALSIAQYIPEDQYILFVDKIFDLYSKEIDISSIFNTKKENKKLKPKTNIKEEKSKKVNISDELSNIINK